MFEIGRLTRLDLGVVGENDTREIQIDVSEWLEKWPEAAIVIDVQKPDESYYPAATDVENGVLKWRVMASDVQIAGRGIAQIRAMDFQSRKIYKSRVVQTIIKESIDEKVDEDAPNPFETWVAQSVEAMHKTQTARNEAMEAAQEATASEAAAKESEQRATAASEAAEEDAEQAQKAAEEAIRAANDANAAAKTASGSAAAADASQNAAGVAEQNAENAAEIAGSSARTAVEAETATLTARDMAQAAAQKASTESENAKNSAQSSQTAATTASNAAEAAKKDAEEAVKAAREARESEEQAGISAEMAQASKESASESAEEAAKNADAAEVAKNVAIEAAEKVQRVPPAIEVDSSGALVHITDGADRPAVQVVSVISPTTEGVSAVTLTRTGKNLVSHLDYTFTQGHSGTAVTEDCIDVTTPTTYDYGNIPVQLKGGVTYTLVIDWEVYGRDPASAANTAAGYRLNPIDSVTLGITTDKNGTMRIVRTYTPTEDAIGAVVWHPNYNSPLRAASRSRIMLLEGAYTADSAPAFEPCRKQTLAADLPETVYGGTLDWTRGLLTITHGADGEELADAVTRQLDPQTLDMMKGENNVWSDTGDTSVAYVADTKIYIDNKGGGSGADVDLSNYYTKAETNAAIEEATANLPTGGSEKPWETIADVEVTDSSVMYYLFDCPGKTEFVFLLSLVNDGILTSVPNSHLLINSTDGGYHSGIRFGAFTPPDTLFTVGEARSYLFHFTVADGKIIPLASMVSRNETTISNEMIPNNTTGLLLTKNSETKKQYFTEVGEVKTIGIGSYTTPYLPLGSCITILAR